MPTPFHPAFHVTDLDLARQFYGKVLGCTEGPSTDTWVDFGFFGHQISLDLGQPFANALTGKVGDHMVPMPTLASCWTCPIGGRSGRAVGSGGHRLGPGAFCPFRR